MVPGIKRGFTHSSVHRGLIIINYDFLNGGWQSKFFFSQCTTDDTWSGLMLLLNAGGSFVTIA